MASDAIYALPTDNVAPAATVTLPTGTENARYPLTNLTNGNPASLFLTTTTTGLDILFDHGGATRVDLATIHGLNFPAGTVIHLQRNAANSWGAPTQDATAMVPTRPLDGLPFPIGIDLTTVTGYTTSGFRYTRLHVASLGQIAGLGEVALWSRTRTDITNVAYPVTDLEAHPRRTFATLGSTREYQTGIRRRAQPCTFRLREDGWTAFLALLRACGATNKFLWCRDATGADPWYARFTEDTFTKQLPVNTVHDVTLTIEELGLGVAIPTA